MSLKGVSGLGIEKLGAAGRGIAMIANGGSPALWTPADDITSTVQWAGNDESTIDETGGIVSLWRDLLQASEIDQSIEANKPLYDAVNKKIDFDGSSDELNKSELMIAIGNPDLTIAIFCKPLSHGSGVTKAVTVGQGSGKEAVVSMGTSGYAWRFGDGSETYSAVTFDDQMLIGVRAAGSDYQSSQMFKNGVELSPTASSSPTNTPNLIQGIAIGGSFSASEWKGGIYEVVIAENNTTEYRQKLEGYWPWKIDTINGNTVLVDTLIPVGHPYKLAPPMV